MLGLMQQQPLLISSLLIFAARHHGETEIVSNRVEGPRHRYTYREAERRARRLARVLQSLGVRPDDRVGTLAWNGYRHYELYFAVSGTGAVMHTVNPITATWRNCASLPPTHRDGAGHGLEGGRPMTLYAGLDVGDKATHLCVVDGEGGILWRGACATDPEALAFTLRKRAPGLARAVLETGALSAFLHHGLTLRGVPAVCICARHAKGVLSVRANKSDAHDAEGLAQLARTGWFKRVHIKDSATHLDRARLKVREQLIRAHRAMANQLRGLLKLFGLRMGKATTPARRALRLRALLAQQAGVATGPGTARGRPGGAGGPDQGLVAQPRGAGPGRSGRDPPDERARRRPDHRAYLQEQHRGSRSLRPIRRRRRLCRARSQALPVG